MANHISHASLPYPIRNARFTMLVPFLDADGDPTDPTTPDTEISQDGGAFADAAEEVTTISGSNGAGYITLNGAETNNSALALAFKVASGPKATLATLFPKNLAVVGSDTLSAGSSGGGTLGTILAYDVTGCFIRTTGGTGGGGTGGANNQARRIITYNTATGAFTVSPNWETTPSTDTTYDILLPEGVTLGMLKTLNPATAGRTVVVDAAGLVDANAVKVGPSGSGTAQTAGDIPALINTVDDLLDTEIAAIKAKTDNLPSDPADASDIAASFTTVNTKLDTIDDFLDTEVAAIKAKTDNLPSDPADASDIAASFASIASTLSTIAGYVDTEVAAIKAKTDNLPSDPADASDIAASFASIAATLTTLGGYIDTEVAAIKAVTDALPNAGALTTIQSDLDNIQTRLPAALINGHIDNGEIVDFGTTQSPGIGVGSFAKLASTANGSYDDFYKYCILRIDSDPAEGSPLLGLTGLITAYNKTTKVATFVPGYGAGDVTVPAGCTYSVILGSAKFIENFTQNGGPNLRSELGLVSANLDTQLAAIDDAIDTEVAAILAAVDTEIAAIKSKTDNLPSDPADASDIAASFAAITSTLSTISGYLDTEIAAILAAVDTEVAAIKAKTDALPSDPADASDIAASFSSISASIAALNNLSAAQVWAHATRTLSSSGLDSVLIESGITAGAGLTNDTGTQLTSINARQAIAVVLSAVGAVLAGALTTNVTTKPAAKPSGNTRVNATVDADGNRSAVALKVPD